MRVPIAIAGAVLVLACACSSDDDDEAATSTSAAPVITTPRPSAEQAAALGAAVAGIYPGVPEGKAAEWAREVCQELLAGQEEGTIITNTQARFGGGGRPNPTREQAAAIVELVRAPGSFCATG